MNELMLTKSEIKLASGEKVKIIHNETDDMLEVFFKENEPATGIELTDNILLRINRITRQVVSLTILHFSILTEKTEFGRRSYPLDNFEDLPEGLRELVVRIISSPPVNQFLKLSYFQESQTKSIPLTYIEPYQLAS